MAIRNILVHVEDASAGMRRIDASVTLARSLAAHLTGVFPLVPPIPKSASDRHGLPSGTQPEAYEMQRQIRRMRIEGLDRARECERRFLETCRKADVESEWRCEAGEADKVISKHALFADLVVIGEQQGERAEPTAVNLADRLVFRSGCPLLVIPTQCRTRVLGDRIAVAWNPDCKAQRALHASLPLLKRANRVELVTVNDHKASLEQGPPAGNELRKYLARHAIPADYRSLPKNGRNVGDTLLSRAAAIDADLIVLGAYHHSRLREILLGGVTRHMLRFSTMPMLVTH